MTESTLLFNGKWLRLLRRGTWEYAERTNPGGAVILVAVTPEDRVLLVEQFRVPIQQRTIEMPAGLIGDLSDAADEHWSDSARRELLEETGWHAGRFQFLMRGPSSAGMSTEQITFARALDLRRVGAGGGDASEDIIVHEVPRASVDAWLYERMQEGFSIDPKLYAGLYFLRFEADGRPWTCEAAGTGD